ncbi:TonB-dependent receptor plug domain-containing protein [Tahibacter amnicola]|uniref:TonB-dependent receptor n=1 Tax=Tahibacter amnicola TaxID=2976241 RepID=A0ABY6BB53_9GAMM|nr:TonB-dependent receptor [Tahibacter amnicola]UXI66766.1 TonB-dependent receptor [Tahibacter amnicola]
MLATFLPNQRTLRRSNLFVQDEMTLTDALTTTLGLKIDRNTFTGNEVLPTVRMAWKPASTHLVWGAVSRAVRAPSRIDKEFFFPGNPPFLIRGGPDFESEIANVFELGYRGDISDRITVSVTAFRHRYYDLRSGAPNPGGGFVVTNNNEGPTHGLEAWTTLQITPDWRIHAGFVELRKHLREKYPGRDPEGTTDLGNDPKHQALVRSQHNFGEHHELDITLRGASQLPAPRIPGYAVADVRWGWRPNDHLTAALTVRNIGDARHPEFEAGALAKQTEFGRTAMIDVEWRW